jgi:BirA family biotin operon repressor/biotin-[acetyl-CoA-carboxylase] ligase
LSTHSDALAWARKGAPEGSVVAADYQASPRGRAGLEWRVESGTDVSFSVILRPSLPVEREGWLYAVAAMALCDAVGEGSSIRWPDELIWESRTAGAAGVQAELGPDGVLWAVVSVWLVRPAAERAAAIRTLVDSLEARCAEDPDALLEDYRSSCATLGKRVRARLIPMGPGGPQVSGEAVDVLQDGALVILNGQGRRVAVRPQNLGLLEER